MPFYILATYLIKNCIYVSDVICLREWRAQIL